MQINKLGEVSEMHYCNNNNNTFDRFNRVFDCSIRNILPLQKSSLVQNKTDRQLNSIFMVTARNRSKSIAMLDAAGTYNSALNYIKASLTS